MINRAKMPRQLRNKGGITSVVPRTNYLFGGIKRRIRKLIPNELASVAVKAAPIVAPFNPGAAALMRGIGRFDQRGSISDALKQGIGTFAFGKGVGMLGGAQSGEGFFGGQTFSKQGFSEGPIGRLFNRQAADSKVFGAGDATGGEVLTTGDKPSLLSKAGDFVTKGIKALPKGIEGQLIAGGLTAGASLLASYFQGEFEEPEPGESMEEYLARRREYVGTQMRTYMDNYFANDPEYSKLDDAGRDAFVARYNIRDGGRVGYQTGDLVDPRMKRSLAQNVEELVTKPRAANRAKRQQAIEKFKTFIGDSAQKFIGLDPKKAGVAQDPSKLEFQEIKTAGLPQKDYASASTYGMLEDIAEKNPVTRALAGTIGLAALPVAEVVRPLYDLGQGVVRGIKDPNKSVLQAIKDEKIPTMMKGSREGILKFIGDQFGVTDNRSEIVKSITPTPDPEGFAAYEGIVPGFKAKKRSDGRFEYKAPDGQIYGPETYASIAAGMYPNIYDPRANVAGGGMPTGIMRSNKAGVMERDYRETGGFVPVGIKEKADDVPAMLSKNEFVFTADAVRGAGNGSIERGAQKMYDTMKRLEKRVV